MEEDIRPVSTGCYDRRHEVKLIGRISRGDPATLVHQGCSVPICDLDMIARAGVDVTANINIKLGELQPHYLPTLHL